MPESEANHTYQQDFIIIMALWHPWNGKSMQQCRQLTFGRLAGL